MDKSMLETSGVVRQVELETSGGRNVPLLSLPLLQ